MHAYQSSRSNSFSLRLRPSRALMRHRATDALRKAHAELSHSARRGYTRRGPSPSTTPPPSDCAPRCLGVGAEVLAEDVAHHRELGELLLGVPAMSEVRIVHVAIVYRLFHVAIVYRIVHVAIA